MTIYLVGITADDNVGDVVVTVVLFVSLFSTVVYFTIGLIGVAISFLVVY